MKAINTLRNYIKYRQNQGANMAAVTDALDEIEAYIHALELQREQESYNPYREALAKICVHFFADLYLPKELYMTMSLEDNARGAVDYPQWTEHNSAILEQLQSQFIAQRVEFYRALADELVNLQEVYRFKTGQPVAQKYAEMYYEYALNKEVTTC